MSITNGPNLGLMVNGLQGEAHYPELMKLWRWLDFYGQPVVKQVGLNTPPSSPADGDAYIIGTSPTGAWASLQNRITRWSGVTNTWETFSPKQGWAVKDYATQVEYSWSGTAWAASAYVDSAVVHKAGTETMTALKKISLNAADIAPVDATVLMQLIGADGSGPRVDMAAAAPGSARPSTIMRTSRGTISAPTATQASDLLGYHAFRGYGVSAWSGNAAYIGATATENFTNSANGASIDFFTTPNGTTAPRQAGSWGQDGILYANYGIDSLGLSVKSGPLVSSPGQGGTFRCRDDSGTPRWLLGLLGTVGARNFSVYDLVNGAERVKIDAASGVVSLPNGINLGGTANLSAYDEGTWTPTATNLGGTGITYSAKWVKVGSRVDFVIQVAGTGLTAIANTTTLTLPFTPARHSSSCISDDIVSQAKVCTILSDGKVHLPAMTSSALFIITGTFFLN